MKTILVFLLFYPIVLSAQTLNDGLVAHYPFNGNANDESVNENHGTVNGATLATDRFGNENSAYEFDGVDDNIVFGRDSLGIVDTVSISAWIKSEGGNLPCIVTKYDWREDGGFTLRLRDFGNASIEGRDGNNFFVTSNSNSESLYDSEWHHLVGQIIKNKWLIWVDGNLISENIVSHSDVNLENSSNLTIGSLSVDSGEGSYRYFNGIIDDVRIYDRVLSDCEINTLFNECCCTCTIYDTIIHHDTVYHQIYDTTIVYDVVVYNDTISVYDTITTNDTVYHQLYDTISVRDTLIIDVLISDVESVELSSVKVFPNPTKDKVSILLDDKIINQYYNIRIVNTAGIIIFETTELQQMNLEIDISQFGSEGLYFVQIVNPQNIIIDVGKIILE